MTAEHLKPILDSARDAKLLFQVAELMARASIPEEVLRAIRMGRMTESRIAPTRPESGRTTRGHPRSRVGTRGDRNCACASVQHDHLATSLSARTSFDPVTRRPDVRGPLHVFPCEPGVQDRLFFVQGVAAASPLAFLASFLP